VQRITIYRDSPESLFECVAKHCPNLVEYFSQETHGDHALMMLAQNCPKLQEVRLTGSYTDATINALARNCHQLRKVRLEPRRPLSEKALTELIKNCPDLVSLITGLSYEGNLTLSDAFLVQLAESCPSIEELELVGANITEAGMNALAGRCVKLRTLSLNYGRIFIGSAHSALPLHALTFLKLYDVNMQDGDLRALLSRCPGLQSLGLSCLTELTEAGLVEAVAQLPPLRLLFLGHSAGGVITDLVLRSIARRGRELRTLTLHCLSDVTDNGFAALVHSSPLLESIDLEGMENSDASLRALTWFGASLRRARFSNCRIGNAGINALVEGCPHLTQLTVHECDRVGKVAMRKVAKFLPYQE
jgi:F-box and leucine-rich repeat protein GRR1